MAAPASLSFATSVDFPNLTDDDSLAAAELRSRGFNVEPAIWDDSGIDWTRYDVVIIRSCWGYYEKPQEFLAWVQSLETDDVDVWNRPDTVRWNIDKSYLIELEVNDIPIVPTVIIKRTSPKRLADIIEEQGWSEVVLKPVIAATAFQTTRVAESNLSVGQGHLDRILEHTDAIVQPFLPTIEDDGEWSLIFVGGEFSHSVRKYAQAGDYRVQEEFGGLTEAEQAPSSIIEQVQRAVNFLEKTPLYARVDGVVIDDEFKLMELELIEPELFFRYSSTAVSKFADQVTKLVTD
jgi:glutathione synthase/RimK-type ligase-like ATP-grasp enzyme